MYRGLRNVFFDVFVFVSGSDCCPVQPTRKIELLEMKIGIEIETGADPSA